MSIPIPLQTTPQSDVVGSLDPDAVSEAIRDRCARAGESLKNNNRRPLDGLPTVERRSELVVLPVANLIVRIAARQQRVQDLSLKTWPPAHEVHPRNKVIHLGKWCADEGRNPRSQRALAGALRTIDSDNANPTSCWALHNLGNYVDKAKYRHAKTIAGCKGPPVKRPGSLMTHTARVSVARGSSNEDPVSASLSWEHGLHACP